jgi:hypothetical protein
MIKPEPRLWRRRRPKRVSGALKWPSEWSRARVVPVVFVASVFEPALSSERKMIAEKGRRRIDGRDQDYGGASSSRAMRAAEVSAPVQIERRRRSLSTRRLLLIVDGGKECAR